MYMCVCMLSPLSCVQLCANLWTGVHQASPGKNIGVGFHFLLQGIFPTQGSNWLLCLLIGWWVLYLWHHLGGPVYVYINKRGKGV